MFGGVTDKPRMRGSASLPSTHECMDCSLYFLDLDTYMWTDLGTLKGLTPRSYHVGELQMELKKIEFEYECGTGTDTLYEWATSGRPPNCRQSTESQPTEVVNLGVLLHNENTTEGITAIMDELHKYLPGDAEDTEHLVPIISGGDLLTAERESNIQEGGGAGGKKKMGPFEEHDSSDTHRFAMSQLETKKLPTE